MGVTIYILGKVMGVDLSVCHSYINQINSAPASHMNHIAHILNHLDSVQESKSSLLSLFFNKNNVSKCWIVT